MRDLSGFLSGVLSGAVPWIGCACQLFTISLFCSFVHNLRFRAEECDTKSCSGSAPVVVLVNVVAQFSIEVVVVVVVVFVLGRAAAASITVNLYKFSDALPPTSLYLNETVKRRRAMALARTRTRNRACAGNPCQQQQQQARL